MGSRRVRHIVSKDSTVNQVNWPDLYRWLIAVGSVRTMHALTVLLFAAGAAAADAGSGYVVQTTIGTVVGGPSLLRFGVSAYLGIPYAIPPLGNLRFSRPQKMPFLNQTIYAVQYVRSLIRLH